MNTSRGVRVRNTRGPYARSENGLKVSVLRCSFVYSCNTRSASRDAKRHSITYTSIIHNQVIHWPVALILDLYWLIKGWWKVNLAFLKTYYHYRFFFFIFWLNGYIKHAVTCCSASQAVKRRINRLIEYLGRRVARFHRVCIISFNLLLPVGVYYCTWSRRSNNFQLSHLRWTSRSQSIYVSALLCRFHRLHTLCNS